MYPTGKHEITSIRNQPLKYALKIFRGRFSRKPLLQAAAGVSQSACGAAFGPVLRAVAVTCRRRTCAHSRSHRIRRTGRSPRPRRTLSSRLRSGPACDPGGFSAALLRMDTPPGSRPALYAPGLRSRRGPGSQSKRRTGRSPCWHPKTHLAVRDCRQNFLASMACTTACWCAVAAPWAMRTERRLWVAYAVPERLLVIQRLGACLVYAVQVAPLVRPPPELKVSMPAHSTPEADMLIWGPR